MGSRSENCDSDFANFLVKNDIFQDLGLGHETCIKMLIVTFPQESDGTLFLDPSKSMKLPLSAVQKEPIVELGSKYSIVYITRKSLSFTVIHTEHSGLKIGIKRTSNSGLVNVVKFLSGSISP